MPTLLCVYFIMTGSVIHCVPFISAWIPLPLVLLLHWSATCSHSYPTYPCRHDLDVPIVYVYSYFYFWYSLYNYVPPNHVPGILYLFHTSLHGSPSLWCCFYIGLLSAAIFSPSSPCSFVCYNVCVLSFIFLVVSFGLMCP